MSSEIQQSSPIDLESARSRLRSARALVCDIDGVLLMCGQPVPGAKALLETHRCVFVSNNSTHTAEELSQVFHRLGLPSDSRDFFLAGEAAIDFVAGTNPEASVMVLASGGIEARAQEKLNVFNPTQLSASERPDLLLLCRDEGATFEKIEAAANAVRLGARIILSNPDLTHPAADGMIHAETGALWAAIRAQIESTEPFAVIGKPNAALVERAVRHLGFQPSELVFLGDNLTTDALAAAEAGIPFIHTGGAGFRLLDLVD